MIAQLNNTIVKLLSQLENTIAELTDEQFNLPVPLLGGATIGQHIRHIVECYLELLNGYQSGTIKYDERKRDLLLQTCRQTAIGKLREIGNSINLDNKALFLCSEQSVDEAGAIKLATNYDRELLYNLEHTVHHMALIRVGVKLNTAIELPADFGVAAATIRHQKVCAQ